MLKSSLETLHTQLHACPNLKVRTWEVGPPASEAEIESFLQRVMPAWKKVPDSLLQVYREVNGIEFAWKHESGLYGEMQLLPLGKVLPYRVWFDHSSLGNAAEHFYVLDMHSPEVVVGVYADPAGRGVKDKVLSWNMRDEAGDETGLSLVKYLDKVISTWGVPDGRRRLWNKSHMERTYQTGSGRWPWNDIEAYIQAWQAAR